MKMGILSLRIVLEKNEKSNFLDLLIKEHKKDVYIKFSLENG